MQLTNKWQEKHQLEKLYKYCSFKSSRQNISQLLQL